MAWSKTVTGDGENASERGGPTSEGNLELFFDLVFTFAMSQVTQLMLHDMSARGFGRGAAGRPPVRAGGARTARGLVGLGWLHLADQHIRHRQRPARGGCHRCNGGNARRRSGT